MKTMNGSMYQKSLSKTFQTNTLSIVFEILFLLLLGVSAVMLRSYLRIPMNIPGRHGLEFMALLIIGRRVSKIPFASVIAMIGASSIMFVPFISRANDACPR